MTKEQVKELIISCLKLFGKPSKNSPSLRVTVEDLRLLIQAHSHKLSRSDVNELIRELRMNDEASPWTILSDNKGYYLSKDREKIAIFISNLYGRAGSIKELASKLHDLHLPKG